MPVPSDNFLAEANAETKRPITLYRVEISDTPAATGEADLYYADYDTDVNFFETNSSVDTARTYLKAVIKRGEVSLNATGQIDSMTVSISNVSREIQAFLEARDGLRRRKVTIRTVFADQLADQDAYVEDVFYVDHVNCDAKIAAFSLSSKLDILDVKVPRRMFRRAFCQWVYAGVGCYETGLVQPAGFVEGPAVLFSGTVAGGQNILLYDGEVSHWSMIPQAARAFAPVPAPQMTKANGSLVIDLKVSDVSALSAADTQLEVSSAGAFDNEEWAWPYATIAALGLVDDTWLTVEIPFSSAVAIGGGVDTAAGINYIRFYTNPASAPITLYWRNAFAKFTAGGVSVAHAKFPRKDAKGLTKANGHLIVDLMADTPARISANSQIEITSSGQQDDNEWNLTDLSGNVGLDAIGGAPLPISAAWDTHYIPLSTWGTTGGEVDVEAINFVRVYAFSTGGALSLSFRNARLTWPNILDGASFAWCDKTLRHCRLHGNAPRFGGQPGIPSRRTSKE